MGVLPTALVMSSSAPCIMTIVRIRAAGAQRKGRAWSGLGAGHREVAVRVAAVREARANAVREDARAIGGGACRRHRFAARLAVPAVGAARANRRDRAVLLG